MWLMSQKIASYFNSHWCLEMYLNELFLVSTTSQRLSLQPQIASKYQQLVIGDFRHNSDDVCEIENGPKFGTWPKL